MLVGDIMRSDVKTAEATDTFADVAKAMRANGISSVVVLDAKGSLAGIVTERDIVNLVAAGGDPHSVEVAHGMTRRHLETIGPKADIAEDIDYQRALATDAAPDVDVIVESAITGLGLDEIRARIAPGVTAALLGGSGVGKSTLINRLVGEEVQSTKAVRKADNKGRHTTVAREMVMVPGAGIIVDTPGMRAIALWDAEDGIASAFPDIDALSDRCRFGDCTHTSEPGCAVIAAVEAGELPLRRLESYRKLSAELVELAHRQDRKAWAEKERGRKEISKAAKRYFKDHPGKK